MESIDKLISQENQQFLDMFTAAYKVCATVLPIYSVGVQVRLIAAYLMIYYEVTSSYVTIIMAVLH